jgi:dipeptidyl aminopeptidase/acylaminoacyl peptidase
MRIGAAALSLVLLQPVFPQAGPTIDQTLDSLFAAHEFRDAAIAPGGSMAAWVETVRPKDKTEVRTSFIYVKDLRDGSSPARRIAESTAYDNHLSWSKDGKLAFFSDSSSHGQSQLYIADKPGHGGPKKLTNLKGYLTDPKWSPDGRQIAMLFIEDAPRIPGPTQATVPDSGVVDSKIYLQRLALVDVASGNVRQVSPEGMYVYEYDWSPDGKQVAYTAAPGPGDDNWYIAQLYTLDLASGSAKSILKTPMQMAVPRWSPDGKQIAFIAGIMSDEGSTGGDIYTIPVSGGAPKDVTPGRKSSPSWLTWLPSSQRILFGETVGGETAISTLDLSSNTTERVWKGAESLVFSGDLTNSAVVRSSFAMAPEVWAGSTGRWQQLTRSNAALHPAWGEAKSVEWKSDGFSVQGWLLLPANYDPGKRYPMVVSIHGGPAAAKKQSWPVGHFDLALLSGHGYFVFFPNPRGSYGEGEQFASANVKDFGYGDLRDILSGVDAVVKQFPVDEKRIGVGGWSYGGFMTMWAVTQTNRFRAAVSGAGLSNWQSYYGENGIDQWMIPYFGASVYDDPAVYAKSSPINFIKNVKTPTLVVVGDRDAECPPAQSYEFWHALKTLGVKTQFVIYPGEGHGFHDPEHIRDLMKRTVAWFRDNMPAPEVKGTE